MKFTEEQFTKLGMPCVKFDNAIIGAITNPYASAIYVYLQSQASKIIDKKKVMSHFGLNETRFSKSIKILIEMNLVKKVLSRSGGVIVGNHYELVELCENNFDKLNIPTPPSKNHISKETLSKLKSKKGFIYLMKNLKNNAIKIGFSKNPKFRERTLQSQEPEIELMYTHPGSMLDESTLHELFKDKRVRGEWFNLSKNDIKKIEAYFASSEV